MKIKVYCKKAKNTANKKEICYNLFCLSDDLSYKKVYFNKIMIDFDKVKPLLVVFPSLKIKGLIRQGFLLKELD